MTPLDNPFSSLVMGPDGHPVPAPAHEQPSNLTMGPDGHPVPKPEENPFDALIAQTPTVGEEENPFTDLAIGKSALSRFGYAAARNAVAGVGGSAKGAAEMLGGVETLASSTRRPYYDAYKRFAQMSPAERAAVRAKIRDDKTLTPANRQDLQAALSDVEQGDQPVSEAEFAPIFDPAKSKLVAAGKGIEEAADKAFPMTTAEKDTFAGKFGAGVGGAGSAVALGALGSLVGVPELGVVGGAAQMGTMSAADAAEEARAKGASPETVAKAALSSGAVNTALGAVDVGAVLRPIEAAGPGLKNWAIAQLKKAAQNGVIFTGIGEAQQYLSDTLARQFYDPDREYQPDIQRAIVGFATGAALSAGHGAVEGVLGGGRYKPKGEAPQEPAPAPEPAPEPKPPAPEPAAAKPAPELPPLQPATSLERLPERILQRAVDQGRRHVLASEFSPVERETLADQGILPTVDEHGQATFDLAPLIAEAARRQRAAAGPPQTAAPTAAEAKPEGSKQPPPTAAEPPHEPATGLERVPQQILQQAVDQEHQHVLASEFSPVEREMLAEHGVLPTVGEHGRTTFDLAPLKAEAERRQQTGTWDPNIPRGDESHIANWEPQKAPPTPPTTPERPDDIAAQIGALTDPRAKKDAVFVAAGNTAAIPTDLPPGIHVEARPEGVLLTTNPAKAGLFRTAPTLTDAHMARILGYPETKAEAQASGNERVVEAVNDEGAVVAGAVASPAEVPATERAVAEQAGPDAHVEVKEPVEAQKQRAEEPVEIAAAQEAEREKEAEKHPAEEPRHEPEPQALSAEEAKAEEEPPAAAPEPERAPPAAPPEIVEHTTQKGKVLRGVIRTDLSMQQAKAIDKFTFKKGRGWFIRLDALKAAGMAPGEEAPKRPEPAPAPAPKPEEPRAEVPPPPAEDGERPKDGNGHPIFKEGERVVIGDAPGSPMQGRHGVIHAVTGITMAPIIGGGMGRTSYHFLVKTDAGARVTATRLQSEVGEAPTVVPDIFYNGNHFEPTRFASEIVRLRRNADHFRGKADRARTPKSRREASTEAAESKAEADRKQKALDAWKAAHPEASATLFGSAPAKPAPAPAEKWQRVGLNRRGHPLFADENGVHSYVENGIRVTEPVGVRPDGKIDVKPVDQKDVDFRPVTEKTDAEHQEVMRKVTDAFREHGDAAAQETFQRETDGWPIHQRAKFAEAVKEALRIMREPPAPPMPPTPPPRAPEAPKPSAESKPAAEAPKAYGANNKLVSVDRAEEVRRKLREKLGGQLNAGIDPEMVALGAELAVFHIEAGARKFLDVARAIAADLGTTADKLRPYLRSWYNGARDMMEDHGLDVAGMDAPDVVREHLERLGQEEPGGLQNPLRPGDEGEGSGPVPPAPEDRQDGSLPPGEEQGGPRPAEEPAAGPAEGPERPADHGGEEGSGGAGPGGDVRLPETGRPKRTRAARRPAEEPDANVVGQNYRIEPGALEEDRGEKAKAADNLAAIELALKLEAEKRPATVAEQAVLAKYVGWGGLSGAFRDPKTNLFRKGFEDIGGRLETLLTKEQHETASRSTQYAHYTSERVIRAMWDAVKRMGFTGGNVFEPGMGVGHFLGLMPADLGEKSSYRGVEMDHMSALIARLLYPKSGVEMADFTRLPMPEGVYDLAIGNPPFGAIEVSADPKYARHKFLLHDYFFAKTLDSVRPGGLMAFVTSAGTMNKIGTAARQYLAERAEFVGGVRLPSSAFKENAGTEVTTDILFFKRRPEGRIKVDKDGLPDWAQTVDRTLPTADGGTKTAAVNRYFADHPQQVLGREGFFDKLYKDRYAVHPDPDLDMEKALPEALERLPADVMTPPQTPEERAAIDLKSGQTKDGSYYVDPKGRLMQYEGGAGRPVDTAKMSKDDIERVKHMVPIRDALRDTLRADLAGDADGGAAARALLNEHYDRFVAKFGPINKSERTYHRPTITQQEVERLEARERARSEERYFDDGEFNPDPYIGKLTPSKIAKLRQQARDRAKAEGRKFNEGEFDPSDMPDVVREKLPNIHPFREDPEHFRLRSIEDYNDDTGEATKKDVFFRSVLSREKEAEINSAHDGVLWSLNKLGRFDLDAMADKMGRPKHELISELGDAIFRVPGTDDTYHTKEEYLSGDVVSKLQIAKTHAQRDPSLQRNVEALEKAIPTPLAPTEIDFELGMPWIPVGIVKDFISHLGLGRPDVSYSASIGSWLIDRKSDRWSDTSGGEARWSTGRRRAFDLLSDVMNRKPQRVVDKGDDGKTYFNERETQIAQDKANQIAQEFKDWIMGDQERADKLATVYNDTMNRTVLRQYDGTYLTTPGINAAWKWRPHQTRVVSRIILSGNTYMAHAVGAGKTSAMIGSGMEMRRLGLVKKPMYVVPNHMLGQFTKEFYEQYPTARIAVATPENFDGDRRRQFMSNVAQDDLDAVIITHSSFGKVPISGEFQDLLVREEIENVVEAIKGLDKKNDNLTIKKLEAYRQRLEQRLSKRGGTEEAKDKNQLFEEMGVDFLFVDEAHEFRKLSFSTKHSNLKGITPSGSQMAWDLYTKARYLDSLRPGRSLVLASGTPITNTMGELYSLSRFIQPRTLQDMGLGHFDSWMGAFATTKTALESNVDGSYRPVTRLASFMNAYELYKMVGQVMDVVTPTELSQYVIKPKADRPAEPTLAPRTEAIADYQQTLAQRLADIKQRGGKAQKGDDIVLSVINDGRHMAIDMRLVGEHPNDPRSKLNIMLDNVIRIYNETKDIQFYDPGSNYEKPSFRGPATQMVFANLGVNPRGPMNFSGYTWMKQRFRAAGIPDEHVAFIGDYEGHVARQKLFNDMNEGRVRILVGSTKKMGTGVNAQRRLIAIHNQDPLWFPADDEQRNGRGLRQGNHNPVVQIHDYATDGTYDSDMFQMMGRKGRFIEQFFRGDPNLRHMEDIGEASLYEQAAAITTADPRVLQLTQMKEDLRKAEIRESGYQSEQYRFRKQADEAEKSAAYWNDVAQIYDSAIKIRQPTAGDAFRMKVGGQEFKKRADAAAAWEAMAKARYAQIKEGAVPSDDRPMPVAEIGGFRVMQQANKDFVNTFLELPPGNYPALIARPFDGTEVVRAAERALRDFEDEAEGARRRGREAQSKAEALRREIGKPFQSDVDIPTLRAKVDALEQSLRTDAEQKIAEDTEKTAPDWAKAAAKPVAGKVVYHEAEVALIRAFRQSDGAQIYLAAVKRANGNWARTDYDVTEYKNKDKAFTGPQLKRLISARAQEAERDNLLHQQRPNGPFDGDKRIAYSASVPPVVADAIDGLMKVVGLDKQRVFVTMPEDLRDPNAVKTYGLYGPYGRIGAGQMKEGGGAMQRLPNGDYYLLLTPYARKSATIEVIAHEIGHILEREAFENAPWAEQRAIRTAYEDWLKKNGGQSVADYVKSLRAHTMGKVTWIENPTAPSSTLPYYWKSFGEWFADQVSRWMTTEAKPLSIVDKFFAKVAAGYRRLMAAAGSEKYRAVPAMRDWLDRRTPPPREDANAPRFGRAGADATATPLHSAVQRAVDGLPQAKGTGEQMLRAIERTPGVRKEELEWTGLPEWLKEQKSVTREQVADYVRQNAVDVREVTRGGPDEPRTRYSDYASQNGNYREMLLTWRPRPPRDVVDPATYARQMREKHGPRWPSMMTNDEMHEYARLEQAWKDAETSFRSGHWEEPNVLAHVRFSEARGEDGARTLHVEEVQSDWHQKGRQHGYRDAEWERAKEAAALNLKKAFDAEGEATLALQEAGHALHLIQRSPEHKALLDRLDREHDSLEHEFNVRWLQTPPGPERERVRSESEEVMNRYYDRRTDALSDYTAAQQAVSDARLQYDVARTARRRAEMTSEELSRPSRLAPNAPFKTSWPALALRRMLMWAVEHGYDRVTWAPGGEQVRRFRLGDVADHLEYDDDGYIVARRNGEMTYQQKVAPQDLPDLIGKDLAEKLLAETPDFMGSRHLRGDQMNVGGHGMRAFYDQMLPAELKKIVKPFGATVREVGKTDHGEPVMGVDVTPEMRMSLAQNGLPLFQRGHEAEATPHPEAVEALIEAASKMTGGKIAVEAHPTDAGVFKVKFGDGKVETVFGYVVGKLLRFATEPDRMNWNVHHEVVHALAALGVFKPAEWKALREAAIDGDWLQKYKISRRYPGLDLDKQIEEAICERFADFSTHQAVPTGIAGRMWSRLVAFVARVKSALAGRGFTTPEQIFQMIRRGEIGTRPEGAEAAHLLDPERAAAHMRDYLADPEGVPAAAMGVAPGPAYGRALEAAMSLRKAGQSVADWSKGILDDVHKIFSPTSREGARAQELVSRKHKAALERSTAQSFHRLEDFYRAVARLPEAVRLDIWHRAETGRKQATAELQAGIDAVQGELKKWAGRIQSMGEGHLETLIDNYMGRAYSNYREWKAGQMGQPTDEAAARDRAVAGVMSKGPLLGGRAFLKQRTFPTLEEAMAAGLKPVTTNPVEMQLMKLREMQKFYHGSRMAEEMKSSGLATWVPWHKEGAARAANMRPLDDSVFRPRGTQEGVYGLIERGSWMAPEPVARIFNNAMSKGWRHEYKTLYGAARAANNAINSAQLGLSGFHATFVANDTITSKMALAIQQFARGDMKKGAASAASAIIFPHAIYKTLKTGAALERAWLDPSTASPEMRKIAIAMQIGGGRASMDKFFRNSASGTFFRNWTDVANAHGVLAEAWQMVKDSPLKGPFRVAARALDTLSHPIMGVMVPRAKMGVFADLAKDWIDRHPTASNEEVADAMSKFWDTVDDRLGEMVYDNVFWNQIQKDIAFIATRSVGWNLGTIRQLFGGVLDTARFVRDLAQGKTPEFTTRMAYCIAMPMVTALFGAVLTYLATGKPPTELLDYFFPPTGTVTNGVKDRRIIPSYMKDVVEYYKDPGQTLLNKTSPLLSTMNDVLIKGKDYYGDPIYVPGYESPFKAYSEYLLNQALPFSIRGYLKMPTNTSMLDQTLNFWGIQPAPASIVNPEKELAWKQRQEMRDLRVRQKEIAKGRHISLDSIWPSGL